MKKVMTVFESLRTINGLSVKEIADKLGVTTAYIRAIENGERKPSRNVIDGLSEVFNMRPSQLLYLSEEVEENKHKYNYRASIEFLLQKLAELQEIKKIDSHEKITNLPNSVIGV